jgi:hypothetical protein
MRKEVVFFIFVGVFFANMGFVSAQVTCSDPSQVIFKISSENNAHGSFWDQGNYNYEICYNDIFGNPYVGSNLRDCTGTNKIVGLSNTNNAHFEKPSGINYGNNVCYGDLVCRVIGPSETKNADEEVIVKLTSDTNAHASLRDYSNGYGYRVVCSSGRSLDWKDGKGNSINDAGRFWTVYLWYESQGLQDGDLVEFEIWETTGLADDLIKTISDVEASSGKAIAEWFITRDDLDKASAFDNFVFRINGEESRSISIDENYINTAPQARIINPVGDGIYFLGETINISGSCFDLEGPVEYNWNIEKGDGVDIDNTHIGKEFDFVFPEPGVKLITLRCVDANSESDEERVEILVLDGPGVYSKISSPEHLGIVQGKKIDFSGEGSYVVESSLVGEDYTINCLGGDCPLTTQGCPLGYSGNCPIDIQDPGLNRGDYDDMGFLWEFFGIGGGLEGSLEGLGLSEGSRVYSSYGDNLIRLILSLDSRIIQDQTFNEFQIVKKNGCSSDGSFWYDGDTGLEIDPTQVYGVCNLDSGEICCPSSGDYDCIDDASGNGNICVQGACNRFYEDEDSGDTFVIETCGDYNKISGTLEEKKRSCNADCVGAYDNSIEEGLVDIPSGFVVDNEKCTWIEEDNECGYSYSKVDVSGNGIEPPEGYSCVMKIISETSCSEGFKEVNYEIRKIDLDGNVDLDDDGYCEEAGTKTIPCGKPSIKLPGFGNWQLIISLIVLGFLYLLKIIFIKNVKLLKR